MLLDKYFLSPRGIFHLQYELIDEEGETVKNTITIILLENANNTHLIVPSSDEANTHNTDIEKTQKCND